MLGALHGRDARKQASIGTALNGMGQRRIACNVKVKLWAQRRQENLVGTQIRAELVRTYESAWRVENEDGVDCWWLVASCRLQVAAIVLAVDEGFFSMMVVKVTFG